MSDIYMLSHVYAIANPCTGGSWQSESAIYIERRGNLTRHSKVHSLRDYSGVLLLRFLLFCCRPISIPRVSANNRPQISGFFFPVRCSRQRGARHPQSQFLRQAVCVSIMKLTLFTWVRTIRGSRFETIECFGVKIKSEKKEKYILDTILHNLK